MEQRTEGVTAQGKTGPGKLTLRESHNGIMDAGSLGSSLHLIIPSCDAAIANIVGNGVIEEDGVLGHNSNVRPEGDLGHLGQRDHIPGL